jgi:hypothetical protein
MNTDMSMPAVKCLPSDEMTMTRASASLEILSTASGSSFQNSGVIELALSGRLKRIWAIWSAISTVKQA